MFGQSVGVEGETVVVGDYLEDAGAVYVVQRDHVGAENWGEVTRRTASAAETLDGFGYSVAVSNDTAFVGAFREDAGAAVEPAREAPVRVPAARDRRAGQFVIDQHRR